MPAKKVAKSYAEAVASPAQASKSRAESKLRNILLRSTRRQQISNDLTEDMNKAKSKPNQPTQEEEEHISISSNSSNESLLESQNQNQKKPKASKKKTIRMRKKKKWTKKS